MTDSTHEKTFIAAFVVAEKRDRYEEFLAKPKRRHEILRRFNHFFDFLPARCRKIERDGAAALAEILRRHGAKDVGYVIGGDNDGETLPLHEAIHNSLGSPCGAVVSCVPGKLALFLQEFPPGDVFLLEA
jgi:hypothetical protein